MNTLDLTRFNSSFHRVGKKIETSSVREAIDQAGLNWIVGKKEIQTTAEGWPLPHFRGIFRLDTQRNLGVVGADYGVVQNDEAAEVLQDAIDTSSVGIKISQGATIFGGDYLYLSCEYGDPVMIGNEEFVRTLVCSWGHNGGIALRFMFMMMRRRTGTILKVQLPDIPCSTKIVHTKNAKARLKIASKVLADAGQYFDDVARDLNLLNSTALLDDEFKDIINDLIPMPDDPAKKRGVTVATNKRNDMLGFYGGESRTCLGGLLAIGEFCEAKGSRVRRDKQEFGEEEVKVKGNLFGTRSSEMQNAFKALLAKAM